MESLNYQYTLDRTQTGKKRLGVIEYRSNAQREVSQKKR
jgi:hypothetical protein